MADIGRPRAIDEEVVRKLEDGFLMGFNDRECCLYADIAPSTLYKFCEENPGFTERKEMLKDNIKMIAKKNVSGGIKNGDRSLSQWYLERKDKEFSNKSDITSDGKPIPILNVLHNDQSSEDISTQ